MGNDSEGLDNSYLKRIYAYAKGLGKEIDCRYKSR